MASTLVQRNVLDTSFRGTPLDFASLEIENGETVSDYIHLAGNAVISIYCPASIGSVVSLTAEVSKDGITWLDLATWTGITPVASDAFQISPADIYGHNFFRLKSTVDPGANVTFDVMIKAV